MAAPVSVVVPACNAQETILETIESVLQQTFSAFDLIVIDDGSTDATLDRLRSVRDPRLRVFSYSNGGLGAARNRGIERSRGEFVSFIDADDLWTPDKLESQVRALRRRPEAAVAYSWTAFIDGRGGFLFAKEPCRVEGDVNEELVRNCFVASGSNVLMRRSSLNAVGGFDTTLEAAQDWDLCLRMAARWPFVVVPRYQILYRVGEDTLSGNAARCERACLRVCERALARMPLVPARVRNESLSNVKQYVAFLYLARSPRPDFVSEAGRRLVECVRLFPRTLLTRKTVNLVLTWLLLQVLPRRTRRPAVTALLRWYGRWLVLRRPNVRALVASRAREAGSVRRDGARLATSPTGEPAGTLPLGSR